MTIGARPTGDIMNGSSICIAAYGRPDYLERSVKSVLECSIAPFEVIIVDDCSPNEEVGRYLATLAGNPNIRAFRNEKNSGVSATFNRAFAEARYDCIIHLESDCVITRSGWNKIFESYFDSHPEIGQLGPVGSGRSDCIIRQGYKEFQWLLGGCWSTQKKVFDEIGGWDPRLVHQVECLTGDTKIPLLIGQTKTIKELADMQLKNFWVYSIDKNGKIVAGKCTEARKTKELADIIKITLDDGESFKCTSDHLVMMRDGTYKEAKDLKEEDSLMPLYRKQYLGGRKRKLCYEKVFVPKYNHYVPTHIQVVGVKGLKMKNMVIHHKNYNPLDNNPDNLVALTNREHFLTHRLNPASEKRRRENIKKAQSLWPKEYKDSIIKRQRSALVNNKEWQTNVRVAAKEMAKTITREKRNEMLRKSLEAYPLKERLKKMLASVRDPIRGKIRTDRTRKTKEEWSEEKKKDVFDKQKLVAKNMWGGWTEEEKRDVGKKISVGIRRAVANCSPQRKAEISKVLSASAKRVWESFSDEFKEKRNKRVAETTRKSILAWYDKLSDEQKRTKNYNTSLGLQKYFNDNPWARFKCGRKTVLAGLKRGRFFGPETLKKYSIQFNHAVRKAERLQQQEPVYDLICVEPHNNFAIGAGVFVHNCDWSLRVRMAGYRVAEIQDFGYLHLGEGDYTDTPARQAATHEGTYNFLKKWNLRFMGFQEYRAVHAMSWDDFPVNEWFRRQCLAGMELNAVAMPIILPHDPRCFSDPAFIKKFQDLLFAQTSPQEMHRVLRHDFPQYEIGWGAWDLVYHSRPPGREREKELSRQVAGGQVFANGSSLETECADKPWVDLIKGKEWAYEWVYLKKEDIKKIEDMGIQVGR